MRFYVYRDMFKRKIGILTVTQLTLEVMLDAIMAALTKISKEVFQNIIESIPG